MNYLASLNRTLAIKTVVALSTMACVYLFTLWSLVPLVFPGARDFVFYVSGGILQLVLLPVIMVGQSLMSRHAEERAEQDHNALIEAVSDLRHIMTEEDSDVSLLADISRRLTAVEAILTSATTRL